ncbi:divisome protein SepX/GlpR [Parasphingorhabdus pacifica]
MLSSLIFAALAAAWLVVLVPIFARRRQEVSHTTDTALAARVVRRGSDRQSAPAERSRTVKEASRMSESDRADAVEADFEDEYRDDEYQDDDRYRDDRYQDDGYRDGEYEDAGHPDDDQRRSVNSDDVRSGRRYRPGRGGFDPDAAALAARTKYARRQRIVLVMLLSAVTTALLAGFAWSALWWLHAIADVSLVGYLTYLRRQVRIEEEVRSRRLARMSGSSDEEVDRFADEDGEFDEDLERIDESGRRGLRHERDGLGDIDDLGDLDEFGELEEERRMARRYSDAVVIDIDDEDPMFDELDERTWEPYRRAAGE